MAAGVAWLERCLGTCVPCERTRAECAVGWGVVQVERCVAAMVGQLLLQRYQARC